MVEQPLEISQSIHKHKQDLAWQIIVPIVLVGLLVIAGAVFITVGRKTSPPLWRDISLIWILFPALFITLIGIIILAAAIYGMARLHKAAPRVTSKAQELSMMAAHGIQNAANATSKPFIWLGQAGTALRAIFKR